MFYFWDQLISKKHKKMGNITHKNEDTNEIQTTPRKRKPTRSLGKINQILDNTLQFSPPDKKKILKLRNETMQTDFNKERK